MNREILELIFKGSIILFEISVVWYMINTSKMIKNMQHMDEMLFLYIDALKDKLNLLEDGYKYNADRIDELERGNNGKRKNKSSK